MKRQLVVSIKDEFARRKRTPKQQRMIQSEIKRLTKEVEEATQAGNHLLAEDLHSELESLSH